MQSKCMGSVNEISPILLQKGPSLSPERKKPNNSLIIIIKKNKKQNGQGVNMKTHPPNVTPVHRRTEMGCAIFIDGHGLTSTGI